MMPTIRKLSINNQRKASNMLIENLVNDPAGARSLVLDNSAALPLLLFSSVYSNSRHLATQLRQEIPMEDYKSLYYLAISDHINGDNESAKSLLYHIIDNSPTALSQFSRAWLMVCDYELGGQFCQMESLEFIPNTGKSGWDLYLGLIRSMISELTHVRPANRIQVLRQYRDIFSNKKVRRYNIDAPVIAWIEHQITGASYSELVADLARDYHKAINSQLQKLHKVG